MRILGLDPGMATTGYAILWLGDAGAVELVEYGVFETPPGEPEHARLARLHNWLCTFLSVRHPEAVAVERPYPNPKMAAAIVTSAAAWGVIVTAAARAGVRVVADYQPSAVKAAAGVKRGAKKAAVRAALSERFGAKLRGRDDGLDAIAVALAHVATLQREAEYAADVRRGVIGGVA